MSLFGKRESFLAPRPSFSSKPATPQPSKPKGLFEGQDLVFRKSIMDEAKMRGYKHESITIPGTGGQKMSPGDYTKLLEKRLPTYEKTGTHVNLQERKNILRQMRKEDGGTPSRERRVLEEQWGLKGKYN